MFAFLKSADLLVLCNYTQPSICHLPFLTCQKVSRVENVLRRKCSSYVPPLCKLFLGKERHNRFDFGRDCACVPAVLGRLVWSGNLLGREGVVQVIAWDLE